LLGLNQFAIGLELRERGGVDLEAAGLESDFGLGLESWTVASCGHFNILSLSEIGYYRDNTGFSNSGMLAVLPA
jgi:hypothetical protein